MILLFLILLFIFWLIVWLIFRVRQPQVYYLVVEIIEYDESE